MNDRAGLKSWVVTPALLPQTQIAALPGVLHETLAHASDIENTIPRRMVLASRFRGSGLRFSLSGLACVEIAPGEIRTQREAAYRHERHSKPVPGWDSCVVACARAEAG